MWRSAGTIAACASAALLSACGSSEPERERDEPRESGGSAALTQGMGKGRDACRLSEPRAIAAAFGARPGSEGPGPFPATCAYPLEGGASPEVIVADVGPAWTWRRLRTYYVQTRGELRPVPALGRAAFITGDRRGYEIVVRGPRRIFTVVAEGGEDLRAVAAGVETVARQVERELR
jgi:hypothetical protein